VNVPRGVLLITGTAEALPTHEVMLDEVKSLAIQEINRFRAGGNGVDLRDGRGNGFLRKGTRGHKVE
jgi:hypothetical protein